MELTDTFLKHFDELQDPRENNHNRRHNFRDIIVIALLGTICGCDTWVEICVFAKARIDWLKTFLELPNGIPSHDTFGRVFALLDSEKFEACFCAWIDSLSIDIVNEIISIDGKTLRGSHNRNKGQKPLHLVSAWAAKNRILLGQVKTEEKSNEIKAIPELLDVINVKGSIVTIDAMGCQQEIAKKIVDQGADYVLSLKENQPSLYKDVAAIFELAEQRQYKKMLNKRKLEKVKNHGRVETRRYTLITAREQEMFGLRWPHLQGLGMLEVVRTVNHQVERSKRFFVTSLAEDIDGFMRAVRQHWNVEINLHWSLDVSFKEDLNRTRIGNAAENLAIVRRIALNLLKQETSSKVGIAARRKRAGWDNEYLMQVLTADSTFNKNETAV